MCTKLTLGTCSFRKVLIHRLYFRQLPDDLFSEGASESSLCMVSGRPHVSESRSARMKRPYLGRKQSIELRGDLVKTMTHPKTSEKEVWPAVGNWLIWVLEN